MNTRLLLTGLCLMAIVRLSAQDIDTLTVDGGTVPAPTPSYMIPRPDAGDAPTPTPIYESTGFSPIYGYTSSDLALRRYAYRTDLFGPLGGFSSAESYPGLMNTRSATLFLNFNSGAFGLNIWGDASQIAYFRGYQRQFGYGISATFDLTDRLSLTVFGSYYTLLHELSPAMAGFANSSRAGGYLTYLFSDHWGVKVGGQTVRSDFDNRWRFQPIVEPFYKVNKNVSIGADIGGMLYNIIYDSRHSNPTIPPPVHH
ncbi:MAG: hypothetical protein J6C77_04355 [Muribaculaceae bacterium]|nr:hypothetical protein [Muribaculaceae bacterium]